MSQRPLVKLAHSHANNSAGLFSGAASVNHLILVRHVSLVDGKKSTGLLSKSLSAN
jgi:hypothetical protein